LRSAALAEFVMRVVPDGPLRPPVRCARREARARAVRMRSCRW
jgi:hypothetical protein